MWRRVVLRPKPPNPAASIISRVRHARPDACPASPRPRRQHDPLCHILARVRAPGVSQHDWSPDDFGLSAKSKRSSFTAHSPLPQTRMTFIFAVGHDPCVPHQHTTRRPTWLHIHNLTLCQSTDYSRVLWH
jgi:hypothetical protein